VIDPRIEPMARTLCEHSPRHTHLHIELAWHDHVAVVAIVIGAADVVDPVRVAARAYADHPCPPCGVALIDAIVNSDLLVTEPPVT